MCRASVGIVGGNIGADRAPPQADLVPSVRGHMLNMTGYRHCSGQVICAGQGQLWFLAGLGRVDVKVACARVLDVFSEHAGEYAV